MDEATLEAGSQCFTLKFAKYLIRGPNASKTDEFDLLLEDESVDDKHAMIWFEKDGFSIYDLKSASGTFVNERRLTPLSKYAVEEQATIRFGCFEMLLQLPNSIKLNQSSGFHETSKISPQTAANTTESFTIPETQFCLPVRDNDCSDTSTESNFDTSIPETQEPNKVPSPTAVIENPCTKIVEETTNSQFLLNTQEFRDCCDATMDSDNSENILGDVDWFLENMQPIVANQPIMAPTDNVSASKNEKIDAFHKCEASDMQINLRSQTQTPDLFEATISDLPEKRAVSVEKDVTAEQETTEVDHPTAATTGEAPQKIIESASLETSIVVNPTVIASQKDVQNVTADTAMESETEQNKTVNEADKESKLDVEMEKEVEVETEVEAEVEVFPPNVSPLELSGKENLVTNAATLSDLEPTQVFVSKKEIKSLDGKQSVNLKTAPQTDSDLLPTQVFVPKKKSKDAVPECKKPTAVIDSDLEPTQVFVPKNLVKNMEKNPKVVGLNSTMVTGSGESNTIRTLSNFFENVDNTLRGEQVPSKEGIKSKFMENSATPTSKSLFSQIKNFNNEPEFIMHTPKMIADGLNLDLSTESDFKRARKGLFEENSDDEDSLTRLLTKPQNHGDFDELMQSIKKNIEDRGSPKNAKISKSAVKKNITPNKKETPSPVDTETSTRNKKNNRSAATKRNATEEDTPKDNKRRKQETKKEKSLSKNDKKESNGTATESETEVRPGTSRSKANTASDEKPNSERATKKRTSSRVNSQKNSVEDNTKITTHSKFRSTSNEERSKRKLRSNSESTFETQTVGKETTSKSERKQKTKKDSVEVKTTSQRSKRSDNKESSSELEKSESETKAKKVIASKSINKNCSQEHSSQENQSDLDSMSRVVKEAHLQKKSPRSRENWSGSYAGARNQNKKATRSEEQLPKNKLREKLVAEIAVPVALGKRTRSRMMSSHSDNSKKTKMDEEPSTSKALKIMFTMVAPEKQDQLLKRKNSKWQMANSPAESDILVMDDGKRTVKFLVAVAKGIPIVTTKWLETVNDTGVVSTGKNFFKNPKFEETFGFNLLQTLNKANNGKLLKNYNFFCTSHILPSPPDIKDIISCAGGIVLDKFPAPKDNQKLYIISSEEDRRTWHEYRRKNPKVCIINTEAIMQVIMRYDVALLGKNVF